MKQVGKATSAERGMTTTVVCAMSPSGTYIPSMMPFRRKNMNICLINGAPPDALGLASPRVDG